MKYVAYLDACEGGPSVGGAPNDEEEEESAAAAVAAAAVIESELAAVEERDARGVCLLIMIDGCTIRSGKENESRPSAHVLDALTDSTR